MKILISVCIVFVMGVGVLWAQSFEGQTIVLDDNQTVTILPLQAVTESEPIVFDITDTSASVNFVGTIPLACYLVYGTESTFGAVTNDPNMADAAIIEHNPLLLNLEPDTEYVFRMQGVSENGTIYISDTYSFKTLPKQIADNTNLLSPEMGATVREVSSNFGNQADDGRWGILNAFDQNPRTEWSSYGDGDDAYFIVDLNDTYHIQEIQFQTRQMADGSAITESFTLTTDSGEIYGPFEVNTADQSFRFSVDFRASSIRYDVHRSTGGNTGIVDIMVYGTQSPE